MTKSLRQGLLKKFARVQLLLCDVDGVLTDSGVEIGGPYETKRFNIQDGFGLVLLRRHGIKVGWVSRRPSKATQMRGEELKIDYLHQSKSSKVAAVEQILKESGLNWEQVCFVGDDVVDLAAMERSGVSVAVANAIDDVKLRADYVTAREGGHGAVREVAEIILRAHGEWDSIVEGYLSGKYD